MIKYQALIIIQQVLVKKNSEDSTTLCMTKDSNGETPLHKAAKGGYLKCLKFLASLVPDQVSSLDNSGMTPAAYAAKVSESIFEYDSDCAPLKLENSVMLLNGMLQYFYTFLGRDIIVDFRNCVIRCII